MSKKLIALIVTLSLVASLSFGVAFANQEVDPENGSQIIVEGAVTETAIRVSIPLVLNFAIDGNAVETIFLSTPAAVINNTLAPVDLQILNIVADVANPVKVVAPTRYTDEQWLNLGRVATNSRIALGILADKPGSSVIWSPAEDTYAGGVTGTIQLDRLETVNIAVQAKHGLAWANPMTLNYRLYVRVALTETLDGE